MSNESTFEIGLVLAGAVSAGAYTAGVLDFLVQALESWESRRGQDGVPNHKVKLRVITGASAGGICGAALLSALRAKIAPVEVDLLDAQTAPPPRTEMPDNVLYNVWVPMTDIIPLLDTSDLTGEDAAIRSILNSTILEKLAQKAIQEPSTPTPLPRPFVSERLDLRLTVSNLRGIPVNLVVQGSAFGMVKHTDEARFYTAGQANPQDHALHLNRAAPTQSVTIGTSSQPGGDPWQSLGVSALATSAFPLAFKTRELYWPGDHYQEYIKELNDKIETSSGGVSIETPVPAGDTPYTFYNVDGGLFNNEPMNLAAQVLWDMGAVATGIPSPETAAAVDRALIVIDPFPTVATLTDPGPEPDLRTVAFQTFSSMMDQGRFKPDELALAAKITNFTSFLVTPSKIMEDLDGERFTALACGALSGFGGFLTEKFRRHDFMLGRHDCRNFLQNVFLLPADARVFVSAGDQYTQAAPIIPLHPAYRIPSEGEADRVPMPQVWPKITTEELLAAKGAADKRITAMLELLQFNQQQLEALVERVKLAVAPVEGWSFTNWSRRQLFGLVEDRIVSGVKAGIQYVIDQVIVAKVDAVIVNSLKHRKQY